MEIDGNGLASMNRKQPLTVLGRTISTSRQLSLSLTIVCFLLSFAISSHEGKITNLHFFGNTAAGSHCEDQASQFNHNYNSTSSNV